MTIGEALRDGGSFAAGLTPTMRWALGSGQTAGCGGPCRGPSHRQAVRVSGPAQRRQGALPGRPLMRLWMVRGPDEGTAVQTPGG